MLDFGSEMLNLGSERPDLGFEGPDLGSKGLHLQPGRLVLRLGGGRRPETGENCPMWNHRSSAPSGPLPKKEENYDKDDNNSRREYTYDNMRDEKMKKLTLQLQNTSGRRRGPMAEFYGSKYGSPS